MKDRTDQSSSSSVDSGTTMSSDNTTAHIITASDLYSQELEWKKGPHNDCRSPNSSFSHGSCDGTTFHSNLIRFSKSDVFKKYELIEQIGTGSMGTVSTVRIRPEKFGGSAYECRSRYDLFGIPIRGTKKIMVPREERPNFQRKSSNLSHSSCSDDPFDDIVDSRNHGNNNQQRQQQQPQQQQRQKESASLPPSTPPQQLQQQQTQHHEHLYALKTIHLDRMLSSTYVNELQNEIAILRTLDHPNIVKMLEVYHDKRQRHIYVVLELCGNGGDLFTKSPYTLKQAQKIMSECCSAIHYMHEQNVVHRDIKYENVLFSYELPNNCKSDESSVDDDECILPPIKIIDFGLSKKFVSGTKPEPMTDRVGTIYTMAPQVLQGVYSSQADMWSFGVISYMLLSASKPFYHKKRSLMIDAIMRGKPKYDTPTWDKVDETAKDFVQRLIVVDPKERMDSTTALKHPWMTNRTVSSEKPSLDLLHKIDSSLLNYKYTSQLKKIALNVIAHRSTITEILELQNVFETLDIEKNGIISISEFKKGFEILHHSNDLMQDLFASIDMHHSGHIMYTEFLAATLEAQGQIEEDRIAEAFDRIDSDGTGYITKKNLTETLGPDCPTKYLNDILKAADYDQDGKVSYKDFLQAFRETRSQIASNMATTLPECSLSRIGEEGDHHSVASSTSKAELLGLNAKIPGGRFEMDMSCLSPF